MGLIALSPAPVGVAVPAFAQSSKPLLGMLSPIPGTANGSFWQAFWDGMQALGHARDDFAIEARSADGHPERLATLAGELVRLNPRIILANGSEASVAAKRATAAIPIVFTVSSDPVLAGLVASLAHPGGNVTGLSLAQPDIAGKHVELLKTIAPQTTRVAILTSPDDPTHKGRAAAFLAAVRSIGLDAFTVPALAAAPMGAAFAEMTQRKADALFVVGTPRSPASLAQIFDLALRNRLPSLGDTATGQVPAGALISYGPDIADLFRRAATYIDKILKGAAPADLPVEQPTKFQLTINLKIAQALGLTVPPILLAQASEVIE